MPAYSSDDDDDAFKRKSDKISLDPQSGSEDDYGAGAEGEEVMRLSDDGSAEDEDDEDEDLDGESDDDDDDDDAMIEKAISRGGKMGRRKYSSGNQLSRAGNREVWHTAA